MAARPRNSAARASRRRPHATTVIVFVVGLVIIGTLSWLSYAANQRNNHRLLTLQTQQAGSLLAAELPVVQTPIASAAELVEATNGDPQRFTSFIAAYAGTGREFVSASLWRLSGGEPVPVAQVGARPLISAAAAESLFSLAAKTSKLAVSGILTGPQPRLGYSYVPPRSARAYAVYAESALPPHKVAPIRSNSAFADLDYALYLGRSARPQELIETSLPHLPPPGFSASYYVPFGNNGFDFVAISTHQLGGALSEDLWWLIALLGAALTVGVSLVSERLARGRESAEALAVENGRLYAQQRGVAETLQHALLPDQLPMMPGLDIRARYVPGVEGLEVGGDWYDVLKLDEHRLLWVIGDVSGRGLRAAAVMASLRYAIRAYALQGDAPADIFTKLAGVVDLGRDGHFATVLCALIDMSGKEATMVNAGHPQALIRHDGSAEFLRAPVGPPIGVIGSHHYESSTLPFGPGSTLLGFTDGLVERRGEHLDLGFARLQDLVIAADPDRPLDELMNDVIVALVPDGPSDDVALVGLRWLN